ncbi:hypothetical protein IW261DRAFT_695340 [Armillaria novae-zelandiae]|uniref:Uncharacterized protein n=1 Tax=Armillaria novae-zelandiae TaxID=153914 RepID=A0AA39NX05_9AGAR|nr:hypothetical protein IW261DRAFT_695340 [Armillaria novae-zelandiae]
MNSKKRLLKSGVTKTSHRRKACRPALSLGLPLPTLSGTNMVALPSVPWLFCFFFPQDIDLMRSLCPACPLLFSILSRRRRSVLLTWPFQKRSCLPLISWVTLFYAKCFKRPSK